MPSYLCAAVVAYGGMVDLFYDGAMCPVQPAAMPAPVYTAACDAAKCICLYTI